MTDKEMLDWLEDPKQDGVPRIGRVYDHWWHMHKDATIREAIQEVVRLEEEE